MTSGAKSVSLRNMDRAFHIDLGITIEGVTVEDANERALEWVNSLELPEHVEVGRLRCAQDPVDVEFDIVQ